MIYGIHKLKPDSPLMLYLIITASNPVSVGFQGRKSQRERERNIDKDIDIYRDIQNMCVDVNIEIKTCMFLYVDVNI